MDLTDLLRLTLRTNLDEGIPTGGTDAATMFTDAEIDAFLTISQSVQEASWRGWIQKGVRVAAGAAGGLIQATMGSETFKWSDPSKLLDLAKWMAQWWWDQIPPDLLPSDVPAGSRLISVDDPPLAGITSPSLVVWGNPTTGGLSTEDASRLLGSRWRREGEGTW